MFSSTQSSGFQPTQAISSRRVTPQIALSAWYQVWNEKRKVKSHVLHKLIWNLCISLVLPFYGLKGVTLSCLNAKLGVSWEICFQLSSRPPPPANLSPWRENVNLPQPVLWGSTINGHTFPNTQSTAMMDFYYLSPALYSGISITDFFKAIFLPFYNFYLKANIVL